MTRPTVPDADPLAAAGLPSGGLIAAYTLFVASIYALTDSPWATVAAAGAPMALMMCVRFPFHISALFAAFTFFRLHDAYPALTPYKIPLCLGILMVIAVALHAFVLKTVEPYATKELKRVAVLVGMILVGVVFAQDRAKAYDYVVNDFSKILLMMVAVAWLARGESDFRFMSRALIVGGMLVAAVAISNKLHGVGLVEGTRVTVGWRPEIYGTTMPPDVSGPSSLADPNDLSLVLLFPLAFAVSLVIYRASRFDRLLGMLATVAISVAIVFTQSRGGLIGVVAVMATIGARLIRSRTILISMGVVLVLGLGAAMGLATRKSGGEAELAKSGIDESSLGRIYAWETAVNMAVRRPLTGVGIANFADSYYFFTDHWLRQNKAVHSTWFQVLGEMGLPGLVVFLGLVAAVVRSAFATLNRLTAAGSPPVLTATALSLASGLVGFCAAGTFLTQAFTIQLYLMIGLTAALGRVVARQISNAGTDAVKPEIGIAQPAPGTGQRPFRGLAATA